VHHALIMPVLCSVTAGDPTKFQSYVLPCPCPAVVLLQSWNARSAATLTLTQSSPRSTCSRHSPASPHKYACLLVLGLKTVSQRL
jgi:hypothetical protein